MRYGMLRREITKRLAAAKAASRVMGTVSSGAKNKALRKIARTLLDSSREIIRANNKDISLAKKKGLSAAMIDRLALNEKRIAGIVEGIYAVAALRDPVGEVIKSWRRPNDLIINKVRVPIGVIAIIYESRANVTADCAALCLKSGNVSVLRGGSEAINSNIAIHRSITRAIKGLDIPREAVTIIDTTDRKAVDVILRSVGLVDLVIPRGGEGLIKYVTEVSTVPVIKHYKGVCNLYIDRYADLEKAVEIAYNAKVQRPGVCNAIENLIVHRAIAGKYLPVIRARLEDSGVELRGCPATLKVLKGIKKAREEDWYTEYLDLVLSIKIVSNTEEAINFINKYGSGHSDAIVTENNKNAEKFLKAVDSACVYHNASTRFTDGYQFGMGAEIGISTDKLHARGPMALEELCSYKYIVKGNGQLRE